MTYCLAIAVEKGLVFCSDSRTSAGIDQVSSYSKMHTFGVAGSRQFVLLSAGNLATTQAVVSRLRQDIRDAASLNLHTASTMSEVADYVGQLSVSRQARHQDGGNGRFDSTVTLILGGQIGADEPQIFLIYPEGNYITAPDRHPYLQIGESKYGKPILDRVITPTTSLDDAAKCAIVSMDSTLRSNLSVGPPIELRLYLTDSLAPARYLRFEEDDPYLRQVGRNWNQQLIEAFRSLPEVDWGS